ncbi:MAG: 16S rRNA (guanine(527)-N(7))-methyltransferase RsmG [Anaerolineae bacterium]|jgi:16S rRNA (guanine527-N7)-methyltransferase|nr:MAG: 16S rRNA (guanine(527)-N(7))-methyltransferase RsmG [Anaerolineae bacterium]
MQAFVQWVYQKLGLRLSSRQLEAFQRYEQLLVEWNQRLNLTAIRSPEMIRIKHFLDSLTCLSVMSPLTAQRVVDVGSGAGFPGIPLKIAFPSLELTLIESIGKKAAFCQMVVQELGLNAVTILPQRVEEVGQLPQHREQYDWAVARAVANLPTLAEYLLPLVRVGGAAIAMKGESAPAEVHQAERAIAILGGQVRKLVPVHLPQVAEDRYLVIIDKIAATPPTYPRRVGLPEKRPLR